MACRSSTSVCIVTAPGGPWWITTLQIAVPAIAVILAVYIGQALTRDRENVAKWSEFQRTTIIELIEQLGSMYDSTILFDISPPPTADSAMPFLARVRTVESRSHLLDDQSLGAQIRTWVDTVRAYLQSRVGGERTVSAEDWQRMLHACRDLQRRLGMTLGELRVPKGGFKTA